MLISTRKLDQVIREAAAHAREDGWPDSQRILLNLTLADEHSLFVLALLLSQAAEEAIDQHPTYMRRPSKPVFTMKEEG